MMNIDEKAKLARKLTHALHQAPDNPELFANIVKSTVASAGIHITDLSVTTGDLTTRLAEQVRDLRRDARPTFETLLDMAGTKLSLGKRPERVLSEVLGVSVKTIQDHKQHGRIPRMWLDKIKSLPDLDETRAEFDTETQHVVELLAENGYSPPSIQDCFRRIRTSRAGVRQIERIVYGSAGQFDAKELEQMERDLFGTAVDSRRRFAIWLSTQLKNEARVDAGTLNPKQVEKLRTRFKRELEMRQTDAAYLQVAGAAELIGRPTRGGARSLGADPFADSHRLRSQLDSLFGDNAPDRRNRRLSQLTGLDDRHTLDLLNGANAVGEAWWGFLGEVQTAALSTATDQTSKNEQPSFLRRLGLA